MRFALFENMLMVEYAKHRRHWGLSHAMYFWRDHIGNEVDLLIERGGELWPIDMKSGATFQGEWLRGLKTWNSHAAQARRGAGMLINAAPGNLWQDGMMVANWRDAVLGLGEAAAD